MSQAHRLFIVVLRDLLENNQTIQRMKQPFYGISIVFVGAFLAHLAWAIISLLIS
jgi:hypothetical protein